MKSCRTLLFAAMLVIVTSSLGFGQADTPPKVNPPPKFTYPTEIEGRSKADWTADLKNPDPSRREKAIRTIIFFGPASSDVITLLIARTNDHDMSPKVRAVMALSRIQVNKEDVPRVVETLGKLLAQDTQLIIRYYAAEGLARYGENSQSVIPELVKAAHDQTSSWEIRQVCLGALTQAGRNKNASPDVRSVQAASQALTDPAEEMKIAGIAALGYLGRSSDPIVQASAESYLLQIARGSDKVLSMLAVYQLMQIDNPVLLLLASTLTFTPAKTAPKSEFPTEIAGRSQAAWTADLKHADPSRREKAIRTITFFGPVSNEVVTLLIDRTSDHDISPRVRAVMALSRVETKKEEIARVVDTLGKLLAQDTQLIVRYHAAIGLARYGEHCQHEIPELERAARDQTSSWEIRQVCIATLAQAGRVKNGPSDVRAVRTVAHALTDPAAEVKMEAIMALGYLGRSSDQAVQKDAEDKLLALARGGDKVLSMWAVYSLMRIEHPDNGLIKTYIINNLTQTKDVRLRAQAARVVGAMGPNAKPHIKQLIAMLKDPEPVVKIAVIDALGSLAPDAHDALKPLTDIKDGIKDDKDTEEVMKVMKAAATNAIEQINKTKK